MAWLSSSVSLKDSFRGQVLQTPWSVLVVATMAIELQPMHEAKAGPCSHCLIFSYKYIIPYSCLPVYLYMHIACALISLTIMLTGHVGVNFGLGELLPAPALPLPISIL